MKIIKHGNLYELGKKTCSKCGCEFTFNRKDVGDYFNRDEGYDEHFVSCPECSLSISVSEKELCDTQV